MRLAAFFSLFLSILITAGLVPMTYTIAAHNGRDGEPAGLGILFFGLLRTVTFIAAFLLLLGDGRLSHWKMSRPAIAGTVIICVVALEITAGAMQFLAIDYKVKQPFPILFGILGILLPVSLIAAGFLSSRMMFLASSMAAVSACILAMIFYGPLTAEWNAARQTKAIESVGSQSPAQPTKP